MCADVCGLRKRENRPASIVVCGTTKRYLKDGNFILNLCAECVRRVQSCMQDAAHMCGCVRYTDLSPPECVRNVFGWPLKFDSFFRICFKLFRFPTFFLSLVVSAGSGSDILASHLTPHSCRNRAWQKHPRRCVRAAATPTRRTMADSTGLASRAHNAGTSHQ